MTSLEEVVRYYYAIPLEDRHQMTWVLSKATMESLAGQKLEDASMEGAILMEKHIRRDDNVIGLSYEVERTRRL